MTKERQKGLIANCDCELRIVSPELRLLSLLR